MVLKAAITSCPAQPLRLQEPPRAHLTEAADCLLCPPNLNMWIFFGDWFEMIFGGCACLCWVVSLSWFPLKFHWYIVMKMETSRVFLVMKVHFLPCHLYGLNEPPHKCLLSGPVRGGGLRASPGSLPCGWTDLKYFAPLIIKNLLPWKVQCYSWPCLWKQKKKLELNKMNNSTTTRSPVFLGEYLFLMGGTLKSKPSQFIIIGTTSSYLLDKGASDKFIQMWDQIIYL